MVRTAALFLIFAVGFGAIAPLVNGYAEASSEMPHKHRKNRKKYKKFSRQWWSAYHRRVKRQRELAAHRRALRLRQIRLANAAKGAENGGQMFGASNQKNVVGAVSSPAALNDKKRGASLAKDFVIENNGTSSVTVVSPAQGVDENLRSKTVGGIPTSSLRRTIIDQMIKEEGWVVNDYQKEVGGRKVYVVVAQSPGAGGLVQSRLFYFTEAEGRIYRVATSAPDKNLARIEQESEKIIAALQRKSSTQQAELK